MKKEYDDKGNLISETYPDGFKMTYEYDNRTHQTKNLPVL